MLVVAGAGFGGALVPASLVVPGKSADRAERLDQARFGPHSTDVAVLFKGPGRQASTAAAKLASELDRQLPGSHYSVALPRAGVALIDVVFPDRGARERDHIQARIATAARRAGGGLVPLLTGSGIVGLKLERAALRSVSRAELIALPVLLLVLPPSIARLLGERFWWNPTPPRRRTPPAATNRARPVTPQPQPNRGRSA